VVAAAEHASITDARGARAAFIREPKRVGGACAMLLSEIINALIQGLIFSFMGLGLVITYRYFDFVDMTTDGSFTLGGAVTIAVVNAWHVHPLLATALGVGGGCAIGALTGWLHTRFNISKILSGIIVMIMLYSINYHVMTKPDIVPDGPTLLTIAKQIAQSVFGSDDVMLFGTMRVPSYDIVQFVFSFVTVCIVTAMLYFFLQTHAGLALRSAGKNPDMARSVGINVNVYTVLAIALANGLTALSGALFAQSYEGVGVTSGVGMVMLGLAGTIVGGALVRRASVFLYLASAVLGIILIRVFVWLIFKLDLPTADFKLFYALFLVAALVLPQLRKRGAHAATATRPASR
jgi:putative tryptophan/tyrosine transport system permease protein